MFDEFMNEHFGPPPAGGYSPIQMEQFRVALSKHAVDAWKKRDDFADRMKEARKAVASGKPFQMDTPTSEAKEDDDDMPPLEDAPPRPDWGRSEYDGTCQVMRGTAGYGQPSDASVSIFESGHGAQDESVIPENMRRLMKFMPERPKREDQGWDAFIAQQQAERDKKKADEELQSKIDQSVAVDKLINYMEEANKFVAARTARPTFTIEDDKERKMHVGHIRFDASHIVPSLSTDGKRVIAQEWARSSTPLTPSQKRNMRRRRNAKLLHKILA